MPQIVLQLRILWVIEWSRSDDNNFEIDIESLIWSICLALMHLILEGGIIYLDKSAFKMSFLEYALECLGGRVQWIPFQHLIDNLIQNQMYIFRDGDLKNFDRNHFDAESYKICISDNEMNDSVLDKQALVTLDYEQIIADIRCFKYQASYQFSPESMQRLIQLLINCPSVSVPIEFKMSSTNIPIQNLMKQLLCKAQIKLGPHSIGGVSHKQDLLSKLYRESFHKIKLQFENDKT
eukprot:277708_1